MQGTNIRLKLYLLGMLPDEETEALDLRIISGDELSEELSLAGHDLAEDYLEGELSPEEAARFDTHFLTSPERKALVREVRIFKGIAARKSEPENSPAGEMNIPVRPPGYLRAFFRPLLAAAVVVVVLGFVWCGFLRGTSSPLEAEYARLNKQDLSDTTKLAGYSSIDLAPGTFRGEASAATRPAETLTETVLFRLALPRGISDNVTFDAAIRRAGANDILLKDVHAYRNPDGMELRMLVPKAALQKGKYQITVTAAGGGAAAGNYAFTIE